jgi:hypothetical protein
MLGRGREKAGDVAAGGKVLADGAQHDDAHARILVERFEDQTKLIALSHFDDVERRPVENDVGAFARRIDVDAKAVEGLQTRIEKFTHAAVPLRVETGSYSPATSLRRSSLPTGDFGISVTKT